MLTPEQIDQMIQAQIPDKNIHPEYYELMMHGMGNYII